MSKTRADEDIAKVVHLFEYDKTWYNFGFHDSELEKTVDKALSYFSYICYLRERKIITTKEFKFSKYEIDHLLMNKQVIDYLYNIYHYSNGLKTPLSFYYLFNNGKKHEMFEESFLIEHLVKTKRPFTIII